MDAEASDRNALERLLADEELILEFESLLTRFNIFEVLRISRRELAHSAFLTFLLNPQQSHGIGDRFLKALLQRALQSSVVNTPPLTENEITDWNLGSAEVWIEWNDIDILILDRQHKLAALVENKIGSGEHSNQLERYLHIVEGAFPGFKVFPIFLSPTGTTPSHGAYAPISYDFISNAIQQLSFDEHLVNPEVRILMRHYVQMLKERVLSHSEIAELARQIYGKHRRALDLILEHRPDRLGEVCSYLIDLIKTTPTVEFENSPKKIHIQFGLREWNHPYLMMGKNWLRSKRILGFLFNNHEDALSLVLIVGPGPNEIRQRLITFASENSPPFHVPPGQTGNWCHIYIRTFIRYGDEGLNDTELGTILGEIQVQWADFLESDLPRIVEALDDSAISKLESFSA